MKLSNTFIEGKMNKDVDERLLPKGMYPHAENIRVSNTDSSDMGAIENVLGNEQITSFNLTNAKTLGGYADASNHKLYWFTTSDEKDLVIEYDTLNFNLSVLLESSRPNGVLNFDKNYLITGVVKIINGDSNRDLLAWTDDLNPPRIINIERSKDFNVDGFVEDDISLIKKPPRYAPKTELTYTPSAIENNLRNKFLSFSYRYVYPDGERSALSSFTNYAFAPSKFDLDYQTMENEGMVNAFNAIRVKFDTGNERVKEIELVFKQSNSSTIYLVENFNKEKEGWGNDEERSFLFSNNKLLSPLPIEEIARTYDNVPRTAKAMELIGNRLVFGNYVEQYDLKNIFGEEIKMDYSLSLINNSLAGVQLTTLFSTSEALSDVITFDIGSNPLIAGSRLTFDVNLKELTYLNGSYSNSLDFILNEDYVDTAALAASTDFIFFIEETLTGNFLSEFEAVPPPNSSITGNTKFTILGSTATTISIKTPSLVYTIDDTPLDTLDNPLNMHEEISNWYFSSTSGVFYKEIAVDTSLKTNRSYEIGVVYLDEYSRATTVLTDTNNTIYIPQEFSTYQNKLLVNLSNQPPYWADRYKFVIKQNKGVYQTIYTNVFYEDGIFRWVKLEGANVDKVKAGDTLIVKSDLGGALDKVVRVRVLEVGFQQPNFIADNINIDGAAIIEESGLYMKIKPIGFDMNFNRSSARTFIGGNHLRYSARTGTNPAFGTFDGGVYTPLKLSAGSTVRIFIKFEAGGKIDFQETYDKRFIVNGDYNSVKDWFDIEVRNLGTFGVLYTREWGFTPDGSQFYVTCWRDGTATRKITTTVQFDIVFSGGTVIFETEPRDSNVEVYYETEQTFDIKNNKHLGNIQSQSETISTAISELDFFNCYVQGNGAESYRYKDAFNTGTDLEGTKIPANYLNIDLRPTSTSIEKYKEVRRYADLTYGSVYNENTNINGLNEFNLSRLNYKEDIDKKYGFIQKLFSRDTNLVVFQEDKVSYVLFGKDLLMNADGTSNVTGTEEILGQQVAYAGEYGISKNPESFSFDANNLYFTDAKRGAVLRLGAQGITEISMAGLRTWFKDTLKGSLNTKKVGSFDPYYDQYVLHPSNEDLTKPIVINCGNSVVKANIPLLTFIDIDYGLSVGDAGFDYTGNGVPVKYTITWDGNTYTTGFVGNNIYDQELIDAGYTATVGSGTGTFVFNKSLSIPSIATLEILSPLCDSNIAIQTNCVDRDEIIVTSIILGGEEDIEKSITNRYKWENSPYISPFKSYNTIFNEDTVNLFETVSGQEGDSGIPITGSQVTMEAYKGFLDTGSLGDCDKVGFLISDTLYSEVDLATILSAATYIAPTSLTTISGDISKSISFPFTRPLGEQYLYMIWDYRNRAPVAVDDYEVLSKGATKNIIVQVNDSDPLGLPITTIIENPPVNGTAVVQPDGSITYTHNGSSTESDVFTYSLSNGTCNSNIASVFIDIGISCSQSTSGISTGSAEPERIVISFGLGTGTCGITFDADLNPDAFNLYWDGDLVATTSGFIAGTGTLLFNKTTPLPTKAVLLVYTPLTGSGWTIQGICPPTVSNPDISSHDVTIDDEIITIDMI